MVRKALRAIQWVAVELEPSSIEFRPIIDRRPHMPEPPPVRLVAIEDLHAPAAAGLEVPLDEFYSDLLRFDREGREQGQIIYKAENFRLLIDVIEPPFERTDFRPVGIDVPSLAILEQRLIDREIEYQRQKGFNPGHDTLSLRDPAGNWVQIGEIREVG